MHTVARAFALATLLLLTVAPSAFGHALYERSEPASGGQLAAPGQVQVWLTEAVEPSFSKLEVLNSARGRVDNGDTRAVPGEPRALVVSVGELPDGTYTVSWQALSAVDGHVTRGVFPLVVGAGGISGALEETPAFVPSARDVAARWLAYLAALALAGGFIFRLRVLAPAAGMAAERAETLRAAYDDRFRRLGIVAAIVLIGATCLGLVSQAANAADVSFGQAIGTPLLQLLGTRLGLLWEARLLLAVGMAILLWLARGALLRWGGLLLGGALLALISLNSHAAAIPNGAWLAAALDWLHQVAAAAWVGGLFSFGLLVPSLLRTLQPPARLAVLTAIVARFSRLAILAVAVLAVTGLFHSWLQVTTPAALGTLYGTSLLLKLALVAPMLLLGAANLLLHRPGLARAAVARRRKLDPSVQRLFKRVRWAVALEAALGLAVLLATAVLTASEPARETYARQPRPIELAGTIEDVGVTVTIAPGRPGVNTFDVRLDDGGGQPPADLQRVTLRFTYLDQDLGSGALQLEPRNDGSYGAVGSNLSTDGNWQIEAIVRRRAREDARTGFRAVVASAEAAGQPPSLDALVPAVGDSPQRVTALGLMALGLALCFWISRSRRVDRRERLMIYSTSVAVAVIGVVLYSRAIAAPVAPPDIRSLRSPFPPDAASLAHGKAIYDQQCVACHGPTGRGDGPLGRSLRPRPADFRDHMAAGHTDGELFNWVANGVPETAMPAYDEQISEADRWHVINYIRGFAPQDR